VGTEFQDFDFMNDSTTLVPALANLKGITEVYATEDDLSGLITPNTTLTFKIQGHTDDMVSVISAQFQTLSSFAGLNGVPLPASGSQQFDLPMFALDANNKVVTEPSGTPSVRVTITRN
jgi:hypothetical protein